MKSCNLTQVTLTTAQHRTDHRAIPRPLPIFSVGDMGHRFYCFPLTVIVSGGLLGILAAPSAEIKTTECEINNSEPQTLGLVQKEFYCFALKHPGFSKINLSRTIIFDPCE